MPSQRQTRVRQQLVCGESGRLACLAKLLDGGGWDAQPGRVIGLIFGDQWAGDIVAVARAVLDRVGWRYRVAVAIAWSGQRTAGRPMRPGDPLGNHLERAIMLAFIFEPVLTHEDSVGVSAPLAH